MCTDINCDICKLVAAVEAGTIEAIGDNGKAIIARCMVCGDIIYAWKAHDPCPCRDCTPIIEADARQRYPGRVIDMEPSHGAGHYHFHVRKHPIR